MTISAPEQSHRKMLTEQQLRESSVRRAWIMVPTMVVTALIGVIYCLCLARQVCTLSVDLALLSLLGVIPLTFIPVLIADRFARRHSLFCQNCGKGLEGYRGLVGFTRCCPYCSRQIVEGQARSRQEFWQHVRRKENPPNKRTAKYVVWVFPLLTALDLFALMTPGDAPLRMRLFFVFISVFWVGLTLLNWRVHKDRYYAIPVVVSLILALFTTLVFWYS